MKQLCFNFLFVRFNLPKIDFWCFSLPEGLGFEVTFNMLCVRGSESHTRRLVFQNIWTEFCKHKTDIYLILSRKNKKITLFCLVARFGSNNYLN